MPSNFNALQQQVKALLKVTPYDYANIRAALQECAKHRFLVLPRLSLAKNIDKAALITIAESFITAKLVTKTTLKERGWTDGMLTKFGIVADVLATNPHYKSGAPMQLFCLAVIELKEADPAVVDAMRKRDAQRESRSNGAAKAVATKVALLDEWVDNLHVSIPVYAIDKLLKQACYHYGALHQSRNNWGYSDKSADLRDSPDFLERITVNYLRHECTHYDEQLDAMAGKTGCRLVYDRLKTKVNSAIYAAYPDLYASIVHYQANYAALEAQAAQAKVAEAEARLAEWEANPLIPVAKYGRQLTAMLQHAPQSGDVTGKQLKQFKGAKRAARKLIPWMQKAGFVVDSHIDSPAQCRRLISLIPADVLQAVA